MGPFRCIADLRGTLLESPVWDARRGAIFLCDIEGARIHEVGLEDGPRRVWQFDDKVASLGLCDSGRLVVALAREVVLFDPETGGQETLWSGFSESKASRLNDGKVGPDGAFWVGSMNGAPDRAQTARLYRIDMTGRAEIRAEELLTSNGLAWSTDGRTMFHSDSQLSWLERRDFDPETGGLGAPIRLRDLDDAQGRADGGATDAEGGYWSAGVSAGVLNRYDRDGAVLQRLNMPVPGPTMPCFCGDGLWQIAVTSHRRWPDQTLAAAPWSGGLILADSPVAGVPVKRMKGL